MKRICLFESQVIHEGKEILKGHIFFEKVKKKKILDFRKIFLVFDSLFRSLLRFEIH